MANLVSYSVGFVVLMTASLLVVAQTTIAPTTTAVPEVDPCVKVNLTSVNQTIAKCILCVETIVAKDLNCTFEQTTAGPGCIKKSESPSQGVDPYHTPDECVKGLTPTTTTTPAPSTTTPTAPTTTAVPTTPPPTTSPSNTTTTTVAPTTTTPATNTTTTAVPTTAAPTTQHPNVTTTAKPTPAPSSSGFTWGSFFGGIVFTLAISALGYLVWRFYRQRLSQNYHTLSTNLI